MFEGIIGTVCAVVLAFLVMGWGHNLASSSIATQCDEFGKAKINKVIYVCTKQP